MQKLKKNILWDNKINCAVKYGSDTRFTTRMENDESLGYVIILFFSPCVWQNTQILAVAEPNNQIWTKSQQTVPHPRPSVSPSKPNTDRRHKFLSNFWFFAHRTAKPSCSTMISAYINLLTLAMHINLK